MQVAGNTCPKFWRKLRGTVYTDGSSLTERGLRRAGAGIYCPEMQISEAHPVPGNSQTSYRAELYADFVALSNAEEPINIWTDNKAVCNFLQHKWHSEEALHLAVRRLSHNLGSANWIKGHTKEDERFTKEQLAGNDSADTLADKGRELHIEHQGDIKRYYDTFDRVQRLHQFLQQR